MATEMEGYWGLTSKRCDSCKSSSAVLFCRTDAAYLCGTCDARVHVAADHRLGPSYIRHERVWMCEVCEQAPASVTCKADAATLCVTCDADIHAANPLARRHERLPVVPFFEPISSAIKPSSTAVFRCGDDEDNHPEAATWMTEPPNPNPKAMVEAAPELNFFADVDPYLDLDYADSLVPVHGRPVGSAAQPHPKMATNGVIDIDFTLTKAPYTSSYNCHSLSHSMSSSEVGVVPDGGGGAMGDVSNPYGRTAVNRTVTSMDREARVMRYREKRKNRRFEKTIRYASRKAYAETRPRIKGRFAKRVEVDSDVDRIANLMVVDNGYGVVPSF